MRAGLQLAVFGRIALATLLGYLIGLEREYRGKPAGDRTFALLALGSSALVALGIEMFPASGDRVIQGVATGIGFIGAEIIFQTRDERTPHGLTTAAAVWAATAVGVLCGATLYLTAGLATVLTIVLLESAGIPSIFRIGLPRPGPPRPDDPPPAG